jgi:uncharacterized membrane protein YfhO
MKKTIILEKNPFLLTNEDTGSSASIASYNSQSMTIKTISKTQSLLFTSDPYYPGWIATIDGRKTEIFQADYTFRAIKIPSGKHIIIFSYKPISFVLGVYLAIFSLVVMIIITIISSKKVMLYILSSSSIFLLYKRKEI